VGYFIAYPDLLSTWIAMGKDFDVSNVRDALSAFSRLINPTHKKVFEGVFDTLQTGLSKLGGSSGSQTRAISDLIHLIKDIRMDGKQDYDVLGFIYEYLIGMFAASAGKKTGEVYTPHEVSLLMSEIIANHLDNKTEISIYEVYPYKALQRFLPSPQGDLWRRHPSGGQGSAPCARRKLG
jgi:type I restriction enzyme M protein